MVGIGVKPDDFVVYPLEWGEHERFHALGQPDQEKQARWVAAVWFRAARIGLVQVRTPGAFMALETLTRAPQWRGAALYDAAVGMVRSALLCGHLVVSAAPEFEGGYNAM